MTRSRMASIVCITLVVLTLAVAAYAQRAQQGGGNQGGPPGMMGPMGPMGPGMGGPGGGSMAVSDGAVFILTGRTLYKYREVELPRPEPPAGLAPPGVP